MKYYYKIFKELENLANALFDNIVPGVWGEKGFLSLKPLASWTTELNNRIDFINNWIEKGTP